jgi:hypothetical protein
MENLSKRRDRANKTDSNELRTTDPIHVWLREICQRWELAWLFATSWSRFASDDAESTGGAALARGVANRD